MPLSKILFSFEGRINRAKYWLYGVLFLMVIFALILGIFYLILGATGLTIGYIIGLILIIWSGLAIAVKRCHDRGRSGYFVFVSLIPILDIWYLAEVGFMRGTDGPNQYGPDPLAPEAVAP